MMELLKVNTRRNSRKFYREPARMRNESIPSTSNIVGKENTKDLVTGATEALKI